MKELGLWLGVVGWYHYFQEYPRLGLVTLVPAETGDVRGVGVARVGWGEEGRIVDERVFGRFPVTVTRQLGQFVAVVGGERVRAVDLLGHGGLKVIELIAGEDKAMADDVQR